MKKFRIAALMAVLVSVLCLTGCKQIWDALKEETFDTWYEKDFDYSEGKTLKCYCYYSESAQTINNVECEPGLTIVVEAQGDSVKIFDTELTNGKYYLVKNLKKGAALSDEGESSSYKVNDSVAVAIAFFFDRGEPESISDSSWSTPSEALKFNWSEFLADKLIEVIESKLN